MTVPPVRWLALINPTAGGGRAARAWPRLAAALAAAGLEVEAHLTRCAGEATAAVADAHAAGCRRFLAVGGDGTLHEVLNGLGTGPGRTALAAAPCGTGDDWARGLAIPTAPAALAAMLKAERRLPHDAGLLEYQAAGQRATRRFLNIAGVGYDAAVLERLRGAGPRRLRYLWALASGLLRYRPPQMRLEFGTTAIEARLFVALAAIGRYAGGGIEFAPGARVDDGLLDLVAIRAMPALAAIVRLPKLYQGRIATDPATISACTERLAVTAEPPVGVEADGELLGTTPVSISIVPRAFDAIVP